MQLKTLAGDIINGYLTSQGQVFNDDAEMIRNAGFRITEITSA